MGGAGACGLELSPSPSPSILCMHPQRQSGSGAHARYRSASAAARLICALTALVCVHQSLVAWRGADPDGGRWSLPLPLAGVWASSCPDPSPLRHGSVVHVAVLVWVADAPHGLYRGDLAATRAADLPYANNFVQPFMLGVELYVKQMRAHGPMPLPEDDQSVRLNFVYINLAGTTIPPGVPPPKGVQGFSTRAGQWNYTHLHQGVPIFLGISVLPNVPGSFLYPGHPLLSWPAGLAYKMISTDPAVLMDAFGIDRPFTFIVRHTDTQQPTQVPPVLFMDEAVVALANLVEDQQSHIIVHPLLTGRDNFVCDGIAPTTDPASPKSLTPDCLAPSFGRKRRGGARRFQTLISTISDSATNQLSALEMLRSLGVKTLLIVRDAVKQAFTLSLHAAKATADAAAQLNIHVQEIIVLENNVCPGSPLCPAGVDDAQLFPGGQSAARVAEHIAALNPDALIILGQPGSTASWSIGQLFGSFRSLHWSPKALSWGCGIDGGLERFMPAGEDDLLWSWNSKPWDPELRGPNFQNYRTDTNFELLPAVESKPDVAGVDGPEVFAAAFEAAYGDAAPGGRHPMYSIDLKDNAFAATGYATLVLVQKMVEAAQSSDVGQILSAAKSMAQPGMYGRVALDVYGRTVRLHDVLQQRTPQGLATLAPYNIGRPPVFPLPTWKERVFAPEQYSTPGERAVVAITALCIVMCTLLLLLVLANHRAPVIRAATPSFCAVIIVGAILMLSSNFFATLVVDGAQCAASTWLLTLGFTCTYAALFIKTFRIWRIFGGRRLQVLKMRDIELLAAMGAFLLVDIVINSAWAGTAGMGAVRVQVDPARPAYDYWQCDYSGGAMAAVYAHLAIKGSLLLLGVVLTYSVRNTPSMFNESSYIGVAIYNTAFVIAFIVPILAVGIGGREANYQLRAYSIVFVTISCCGLLYVPKLMQLRKDRTGASPNATKASTEMAKSSAGVTPASKDTPPPGAVTPVLQQGRNVSMVRSGGGRQTALSPANSMGPDDRRRSGGSATGGAMASGGGGAFSPASGHRALLSHYTSQVSSIGGDGPGSAPSPMSPPTDAAVLCELPIRPLPTVGSRRGSSGLPEPMSVHAAASVSAHASHAKQALYEAQLVQPGAVNTENNECEAATKPAATDVSSLNELDGMHA